MARRARRPAGEFIRLQLDASHALREYGLTSSKHLQLDAAAKTILAKHGDEWSHAVVAIASQPRFYRGFVEGVTIDARQFLARASELYPTAPIRHVVLTAAREVIGELAASPHLARLTSLGLQANRLGDNGVREIAASPHLSKLKRLDLSFDDVTAAGIETLCASQGLPQLAYVNLAGNKVKSPVETTVSMELSATRR